MQFKDIILENEFWNCHINLRKMALEFESYSVDLFGIQPTVTCIKRFYDKKKPSVHGLDPCCGLDIRIQVGDKSQPPVYTESQVSAIKYHINAMFVYGDDIHQCCIAHDTGSGMHFHLQTKPPANAKLNLEGKDNGET